MKYKVRIQTDHTKSKSKIYTRGPLLPMWMVRNLKSSLKAQASLLVQEEATESKSVVAVPQPAVQTGSGNEMTAPLPGTIIEIFVKAGDEIEAGKVVLVIEAMKMKNSIRSTRGGKVAEILVSPGQTVAHKQALVRFE